MRQRDASARDELAYAAWARLDEQTRTAVLAQARAGLLHPDPDVRQTASAWADAVLRRPPYGLLTAFIAVLFLAIINAAGSGMSSPAIFSDRNNPKRRREARMIRRAFAGGTGAGAVRPPALRRRRPPQ
ncbi:hypothetical protein CcI49_07660 [Frankia sp. CcI49]|nr:hypothetical protein ACG83_15395 [Frankia sp. R43]ONH60999.1 hypothetical protein CcI49_07660 [Frankia sp. CcI49]